MICGACGAENRAGSRFCDNCGAGLATTCPSCGEPNRADARFCASCGHALVADAAPARTESAAPTAEAERRLVTVLFTDLVGFTTIAEDRDPEAVRELLSSYFDTATRIVEVHGGIVEKFIGDAVMAVWGTPVAHEDDAERAVRAGLELVDAVKALHPDLRGARRRPDRRGGGDPQRDEPGHGRRRPRQHRCASPGRGGGGDGAGRRGDSPRSRASDRLRAARRPLVEGQDRAGAGLARRPGRRQQWWGGPRGCPRAAVRGARSGAARAEGCPPLGRPRPPGSAGLDHRPGRHREEPARLGDGEVRRRRRPTTSGGIAAARHPTAKGSRSGRSARWCGADAA